MFAGSMYSAQLYMNRAPSVANEGAATAADADGAAEPEGAEVAVVGAAALGDAPPLGVHAAMNALSPARPVPARKPRRWTRVRAMRCNSCSRSSSAMSVA